ncbi:DUF885 family protein [Nakamurella endophytica]|uniref:DUF885 domain-containing protein n=1 Tax=Nakamurella endophytica TaxID=1748367 RepID=A0A917WLY1_9ACTN|nr:DUF885 family protein [Nakamurella endophytica]GGM14000.1 hypothetical protein GCM10011594_37350 [Nakamurella endophytica]
MQQLDELAERFWAWRAQSQPRSRDDIVRLDRPAGWLPDLGPDTVRRRTAERDAFAAELAAIEPVEVADRVDHRLLRSALARVGWENDVVRMWTQPRFYVDQAIGPVFDTLLRPGVDADRVAEATRYLAHVPDVVDVALEVVPEHAAREFARLAVDELVGVDARLDRMVAALAAVPGADAGGLSRAAQAAGAALVRYRDRLQDLESGLPPVEPVGRRAFDRFLAEVACIPLSADEIRRVGRVEADRAAVRELLEKRRARAVPLPDLPADAAAQAEREARDEQSVRDFYEAADLLGQPPSLRHYRNLPLPAHLEALHFLGVTDDLTGPDRLDEDGVSYVPAPGPDLPYFYAANARDPRAGIVHEGAHYQQLALSWRNPRPVRRHYYDSSANEGIAFYNEELLLAAGLFDDAPHTRTVMWNFMRLRALRVELDVGLAVGDLTIPEAADLLRRHVGVDEATAAQEAAFFAETPGQAMTYQVGKTQVQALVADAVRSRPDGDPDLRALHDSLWRNGNVPIALQRWELLGLTDELAAIGVPV